MMKILILFHFTSFIFLLFACTYHSYPEIKKNDSIIVAPINIVGVALLRNYDSRFYEDGGISNLKIIVQATQQAVNSLNGSQKEISYELLDTIGEMEEFDYTQEYRYYSKKNLIEIQIQYIDIVDKISNLLSLGLLPINSWKYRFFIYDSDGNKSEINDLDLGLISEYWGVMIFPSRFVQTEEKRIELAESRLKFLINEALASSLSKGIKLDNYSSDYHLTNLPFRMKPVSGKCASIISTGINTPNIRTSWTPSHLYHGCKILLKFTNLTDKIINIDSNQFSLQTDKGNYMPQSEINLFQTNIIGNAASTNSTIQPLFQWINLQPKSTSEQSIELFFEYKFDEKPLIVKWQDDTQFPDIIEVIVPN